MSESVDEILATIAKLQKTEEDLYHKLTENTQKIAMGSKDALTSTDIDSITQQINELSASRVNLYNSLYQNYQTELTNEKSIKSNLEQQNTVLHMVENELNRSKQRLAEIEQDKNNQLKMVEITDYYNLKYDAQRKLVKFMAISGVIVIVLYIFNLIVNFQIITYIMYFIFMILFGKLIYHLYDFFSRRPDNFNEHNWWLAPRTEEDITAISENTNNLVFDISGVELPSICIGEMCCGKGTTWSSNGCILK